MPRNVILAAYFPATPEQLFDIYLDSQAHAAFTGAGIHWEYPWHLISGI